MTQGLIRNLADMPIREILKIHEYIGFSAHAPMPQMASDKTLCVWQNGAVLQSTLHVLRDGQIIELTEREDASIGKMQVTQPIGSSQTVEEFFNAGTTDSTVFLHHGTIVFERYKTIGRPARISGSPAAGPSYG